jgi:HlyD family secretion protein
MLHRIQIPSSPQNTRRNAQGFVKIRTLVILVGLLIVGGGTSWAVMTGRISMGQSKRIDYITDKVKRGPLEVSITERGSLDSAANVSLISKVEGSTTIIRIVEEGTTAKEGEVLVELDSSKWRDSETQQRIVVEQAEAALKQKLEALEIQKTQNDSDIAAAELKSELAILDLEQYKEGDYKKDLDGAEGQKTLAEEELKRAEESYQFSKENAKKGYVSQSALEAARISKVQKQFARDVAYKTVEVLTTYINKRQIREKKANAEEFVRELSRVKRKASAAMAQAEANLSAAKLTAEVEKSKLEKLRVQIAACTMRAPQDGEVVYANSSSDRRGGGSDAATIAEGAQVRERQNIINLPDFTRMQVNAKVHESRIGFVREGLRCVVRTEANHGEDFNGIIQSVSSVPLSGNWPNRDLKEYATVVRLTDPVEKVRKLKPGLSAEVIIKVDYIPNCLYVPVQAVVTIGSKQYAFPIVNGELKTQEVKVGTTNDINLEIKSGLKEGDDVVMNPRTVASVEIGKLEDLVKIEEEKFKAEEARTRKADVLPSPAGPTGGPRAGGPNAGGQVAGGPEGRGRGPGGPGQGAGPGGAPGAGAPGGTGFDPVAMFTKNDQDGDGKLTGTEISDRLRDRLADIDTDGDQSISKDEFMASMAKRRAAGGGGGGGGPRGVAPAAGGAP